MTAIRTETLQDGAARWHARHYPHADAFQMMAEAAEEVVVDTVIEEVFIQFYIIFMNLK